MGSARILLAGLAAVLAAFSAGDPMGELSAAIAGNPAWKADFEQEYVPAGFDEGTREAGNLLLAHPDRLRFEYTDAALRVFASDGIVARLVDLEGGACDAVLLDRATWGRLPLAALMDPGAAAHFFDVRPTPEGFSLHPREPDPEVDAIRIVLGRMGLPRALTILDPQGNTNRFVFSNWRPVTAPDVGLFRPALPGEQPCSPEGR